MTATNIDTARELARHGDGRFGIQEHTAPETQLLAPHGTYDLSPDELEAGDVVIIEGKAHTVHSTWVLDMEPETRIAETDAGDLRLDREEHVQVARTGAEPDPEDDPEYIGWCHNCGGAVGEDHNHITFHFHVRGGTDHDLDRDHTPYTLDSFDE